ncbi:hypothetical protein AGMMS50239_23880 [Bacteroidia bacterium]|nr:hypothetical protein AGMMS50239_23880 [Bacteroidia bacterium]
METLKTTKRKKETKKEVTAQSKKLSPVGEWRRKHPHGLEGFVVNDRSVLYN